MLSQALSSERIARVMLQRKLQNGALVAWWGGIFSSNLGPVDRAAVALTPQQNESFRDGGQNRKEKAQQKQQVDKSYGAIR